MKELAIILANMAFALYPKAKNKADALNIIIDDIQKLTEGKIWRFQDASNEIKILKILRQARALTIIESRKNIDKEVNHG
jgi:hypothetical protein